MHNCIYLYNKAAKCRDSLIMKKVTQCDRDLAIALPVAAALGAAVHCLAQRCIRAWRLSKLPHKDFKTRDELEAGKVKVGDMKLCRVYLVDDANYPGWLVLVPRITAAREIIDLKLEAQERLWEEVREASSALVKLTCPFKLNVASIGNVVSQLHVHITGRLTTDPAWPGPCYGAKPAVPMKPGKLASMVDSLRKELNIQQ